MEEKISGFIRGFYLFEYFQVRLIRFSFHKTLRYYVKLIRTFSCDCSYFDFNYKSDARKRFLPKFYRFNSFS